MSTSIPSGLNRRFNINNVEPVNNGQLNELDKNSTVIGIAEDNNKKEEFLKFANQDNTSLDKALKNRIIHRFTTSTKNPLALKLNAKLAVKRAAESPFYQKNLKANLNKKQLTKLYSYVLGLSEEAVEQEIEASILANGEGVDKDTGSRDFREQLKKIRKLIEKLKAASQGEVEQIISNFFEDELPVKALSPGKVALIFHLLTLDEVGLDDKICNELNQILNRYEQENSFAIITELSIANYLERVNRNEQKQNASYFTTLTTLTNKLTDEERKQSWGLNDALFWLYKDVYPTLAKASTETINESEELSHANLVSLHIRFLSGVLQIDGGDLSSSEAKAQLHELMKIENSLITVKSAAERVQKFTQKYTNLGPSLKKEQEGEILFALTQFCQNGFVSEFTYNSFMNRSGIGKSMSEQNEATRRLVVKEMCKKLPKQFFKEIDDKFFVGMDDLIKASGSKTENKVPSNPLLKQRPKETIFI